MIFHILQRADWEAALQQGRYLPASLQTEGFIHCSTEAQLSGTLARFFAGQSGLVRLTIDEQRLAAPLQWEHPSDDRRDLVFPHVYGPLNLDAVVEVSELSPAAGPPASQSTSE